VEPILTAPVESAYLSLAVTRGRLQGISGILCDIDGVLWDSQDRKRPTPGALEAIRCIKEERRLPVRFVTNTTTRSRDTLYREIRQRGYPIERDEIVAPTTLGAEWLRRKGRPSVFLVMREDTQEEFAEFPRDDVRPDYIVIGNNRDRWDYALVNRIFLMLVNGSEMLALHKQRYWQSGDDIAVDIGCFVTGLEYSSGKRATAIGKPEPLFFQAALEAIGVAPAEAIMVGDDIETDIGGAQRAGLRGVLVRTGKFREYLVRQSTVAPDLVIASLGDLPSHL